MFEFFFLQPLQTWTNSAFFFASDWSLWILALCVALAGAAFYWSLVKQRENISPFQLRSLWILQILVAALLLFMLWQPSLRKEEISDAENGLVILLDSSESMFDPSTDNSRLHKAINELQSGPLERFQSSFKTRLYSVSEDLSPLTSLQDLPTPGKQSNLGEVLNKSLELAGKEPLAAVLLISDGSDNGALAKQPNWWRSLGHYGVPVYAVGVGRITMPEDLELLDVQMASSSLPGTVETARLTLRHGRGGPASLKVYDGPQLIAAKEWTLPASAEESSYSFELPVLDSGIHELRFVLEPWQGENNVNNNQQIRLLQIAERQRRVLYVEGEPRWEFKFIRRALEGDPAIQIVSLLRTSPNKYYRQGIQSQEELSNGFPVDRESLFAYDAIIIGSFDAAHLDQTQHDNLRDYVSRRGGSLLMLAGSDGLSDGGWHLSSLANALPVYLPNPVEPTFMRVKHKVALGRASNLSPATRFANESAENDLLWSEMPEIANYQSIGELKPGASTLLETQASKKPVLVKQRYGLGHSYILATSGTWRWQMQLPSEDQRHETFWRQLLWSMVETVPDRLSVNTDNAAGIGRQLSNISIDVKDARYEPLANAEVSLFIDGPSGLQESFTARSDPDNPGVYRADIDTDKTGVFRVSASMRDVGGEEISATSWLLQDRENAEYFSQQQNKRWLERLAQETGGQYRPLSELKQLPELIRSKNAGILREQIVPLWNMPILFLLIVLIKVTEWLLRRRWNRI